MGGAKASGLGSRHGAGRHPQVLLPAGHRRHRTGDEEGTLHVPLQVPHLAAARRACSNSCTGAASAPETAVDLREAASSVARVRSTPRSCVLASLGLRPSQGAGPAASVAVRPRPRPRAAGLRAGVRARGWWSSASVWWTVAMPSSSAGVRLKGRSSTNTHRSGAYAGALGAQLVHPQRGLADALLARDDHAVEQFLEHVVGVAVHAPGVGHERRADAGGVGAAHSVDHRARRAATPANSPSTRPSDSTSSSSANLTSNRGSSSSPVSSAISSSRAARVAAEDARQRLRVDARLQAVGVEGGEQVGRQHPAPVDQQSRCGRRWLHCSPAQSPRATCSAWLGELEHALAELLQVGVVGGAGDRALVVALHEHHALPQRQRRVPADVAHRAPRALLVAGDQLGTGRESPPRA